MVDWGLLSIKSVAPSISQGEKDGELYRAVSYHFKSSPMFSRKLCTLSILLSNS